ncbi:MAG TPA: HEAT repeat domain-containing protein [Spirochaetia bacterium]|nr:HEAT repeat domain-containing protein [Spirochaetia bacterium]
MKQLFMVLTACFLLCGSVFAQESSTQSKGKETTVEERYLESAEVRLIREQALQPERDAKEKALKSLEDLIKNGKVGESDKEVHLILENLSLEGTGILIWENRRLLNNYPDIRMKACQLLGQMGTDDAKEILINVLLSDDETMVLSEAVYALGVMGKNENNQVSEAIAYTILNQDIINPDNNFAMASLFALEKLAAKNNGLNDPNAFRALIRISQGNYIRDVKLKADQVIEKLKKY